MGDFTFAKMNTSTLLVAVIMAAIVAASRVAEGQNIPSCASKLVPCTNYLNSTTKPPPSCCDPLKEAVTKELSCLCNLYNTPGLLNSFRINVTQASGLPTLCGIPGEVSACPGKGAGSSKNNSSSSSSTPASGQSKNNNNNAGKTAPTGIFSFLLIWAPVMFI